MCTCHKVITLLHRLILLESLASSTPLETLWETLQWHPRAKLTLLNFTAAGLADSKDTDSQSHSTLSLKVFSQRNLIFLAGSFRRYVQLVLSQNAAALIVTFGAKSTDVEDPNVVLVSINCMYTIPNNSLNNIVNHKNQSGRQARRDGWTDRGMDGERAGGREEGQ